MNSTTWFQELHSGKNINFTPVLHTTLKTLLNIASKFKKNSKPMWHQTEFRCAVVVARIIALEPELVLADNTYVLTHEVTKYEMESQVLIRNTYYRFIFELTPYNTDSLLLVKIDSIHPSEVAVHLANIINQQLRNTAHEKYILTRVDEPESNQPFSKKDFQKVKTLIESLKQFTKEEVLKSTGVKESSLQLILQNLCDNAEIGNFGQSYIVIRQSKKSEQIQSEK